MAIQLDHLILPVSDIEQSVRFYHRALGFTYEPVALVRSRRAWCSSSSREPRRSASTWRSR
jgi:predicted lactoylglutathione lyase